MDIISQSELASVTVDFVAVGDLDFDLFSTDFAALVFEI